MRYIRTLLFLLLILSCSKYDRRIIVPVFSKSQKIVLKSDNKENITSINIHISGHLDGEAKLVLMLNKKPYKTKIISGNIDFIWDGDWYSNSASIIYKPIDTAKGEIEITYEFNEI